MSASMAVPSKYKNTHTTSEKILSFIIAEVDVPVKWLRENVEKTCDGCIAFNTLFLTMVEFGYNMTIGGVFR